MSQLSFVFAPSKTSNDHQARVLVDGIDILSDIERSALGVDPVEFFAQPALRGVGSLLIGRCECGCVGCSDVAVQVQRYDDRVEWHTEYPWIRKLIFAASDYERSVKNGATDFSWETVERTAERLVGDLDFSLLQQRGLVFEWASGRIAKDQITLSFSSEGRQQLINVPWDHRVPETAVQAVRERLDSWPA